MKKVFVILSLFMFVFGIFGIGYDIPVGRIQEVNIVDEVVEPVEGEVVEPQSEYSLDVPATLGEQVLYLLGVEYEDIQTVNQYVKAGALFVAFVLLFIISVGNEPQQKVEHARPAHHNRHNRHNASVVTASTQSHTKPRVKF